MPQLHAALGQVEERSELTACSPADGGYGGAHMGVGRQQCVRAGT